MNADSVAALFPSPERLYTVVDATLPCGRKAAQAIHAVADFSLAEPEAFRKWHDNGNYVLVLETANADKLYRLHHELERKGFKLVAFYEPDYNYRMTAFTVLPTPDVAAALSHLPSASKHESLFKKAKKRFRF